jgi:hypothetical protein
VTNFAALIETLANVEFILVGGVAATVHGSARLTRDVDVVYRRTADNMGRLATALAPLHPVLRGAPAGLPFTLDVPTLMAGLNFTLTTDQGDLDLLGEIVGGGTYEALRPTATTIQLFGQTCACLTIAQLIAVKRAAGRPRDLEVVAELELIRDHGTPST